MAIIKRFRAFRPTTENQSRIPALPYDVMTTKEARKMAAGNPLSFLHVDKPEIDLPNSTNPYADIVYAKAGENLKKLEDSGAMVQEKTDCFYLYRQTWKGRSQTGLVCCAAIDDYLNNVIKKHEHTRSDKEADRVRHVDACNANTGPIFLTYRQTGQIALLQETWIAEHHPIYDFVSEDDVAQQVWVIDNDATAIALEKAFARIPSLYIADGHHRCAAAVRVGEQRRKQIVSSNPSAESDFFLAIAFADRDLEIMDYNRVVSDLNGLTEQDFLRKISAAFTVEEIGNTRLAPTEQHTFGMYLGGKWYALHAKVGSYNATDPVAVLDVSILQNNLLAPILGIQDPKTDNRIDFVGGIRGLDGLERRVKKDMRVAFALCPATVEQLMNIADADQIMPPKSTWFEPKLLSGLFVHHLDTTEL